MFGKKKQETVNRVDYQRMVTDAEAAGFNPLTALRNGGAAGFSISSTPGAPLSERLADGVSRGVQTFLANFDPMADDKREAEYNLVQAQIANLNANTYRALNERPGSFNVPQYTAGSTERRPSGSAGQLSTSRVLPGPWLQAPTPAKDALPIWVPGMDRDGKQIWIPNPDGPDVEQYAGALLNRSASGFERALDTATGLIMEPGKHIRSSPLSDKDKQARESSWLPSWMPTISFR